MRSARVALCVIALGALTLLANLLEPRTAAAQVSGALAWRQYNILNDTLALGAMDSTKVVDMTNHRFVTLKVKVIPPSGVVAEPWSEVVLRIVGSMLATADSNSTGQIQLQPIADRSYIASATGDSLAYGSWFTANKLQTGNGEIRIHSQRGNATFPYPAYTYFITLENKGQSGRTRYWYSQVRHVATSSSGATSYCKVVIDVQLSN